MYWIILAVIALVGFIVFIVSMRKSKSKLKDEVYKTPIHSTEPTPINYRYAPSPSHGPGWRSNPVTYHLPKTHPTRYVADTVAPSSWGNPQDTSSSDLTNILLMETLLNSQEDSRHESNTDSDSHTPVMDGGESGGAGASRDFSDNSSSSSDYSSSSCDTSSSSDSSSSYDSGSSYDSSSSCDTSSSSSDS